MRNRMVLFLGVVLYSLSVLVGAAGAQETVELDTDVSELVPDCGTRPITIARMQWPSSALLANIHAKILAREFDCQVEIVAGDLSATTSSLATTGEPSVVPELWTSRVAALWNSAIESENVRQAGPVFSGAALEGWFVPNFTIENNPGLTSAANLRDYWQVFRSGDTGPARFVSCPSDWACSVINRNLLKALGLDTLFEIVEPASRFELDTLIGESMSTKTPILFYYWQPNSVLAQFDFTQLDLGSFDAEAIQCLGQRNCAAPTVSAFAPDNVVIALADWVFLDLPHIANYFGNAQMPIDEMNALLAWQTEQGATVEESAAFFVDMRGAIWGDWVGR